MNPPKYFKYKHTSRLSAHRMIWYNNIRFPLVYARQQAQFAEVSIVLIVTTL